MSHIGEPEKDKLLDENNYTYDSESFCYVNHNNGKIFTRAYLNDHELATIENNLQELHKPTTWKIYHNPNQLNSIQNILSIYGKNPV